jgi:hypothetical protein
MAGAGTATKVAEGRSRYQALTNISVPQRSQGGVLTGQNDLVLAGETVELTEDEARNLMAVGGRTGRQHPAVRPAAQSSDPLPALLPRQLSGIVRRPVMPAADSSAPRPDPPGSSQVIIATPEGSEPVAGSEELPGQEPQGALDLPPRSRRG